MNLGQLRVWVTRHRAAAAGVGIAGAAGFALLTRKKGTGATTGTPTGQAFVSGDPAAVANDVTRSIQPQIDTLNARLGAMTPADPNVKAVLDQRTKQLEQTKAGLAKQSALAKARAAAIAKLTRQRDVRADLSKVKTRADVALLTPQQQKDFTAYLNAVSRNTAQSQFKAAVAVAPKAAPLKVVAAPARRPLKPAAKVATGKATIQ